MSRMSCAWKFKCVGARSLVGAMVGPPTVAPSKAAAAEESDCESLALASASRASNAARTCSPTSGGAGDGKGAAGGGPAGAATRFAGGAAVVESASPLLILAVGTSSGAGNGAGGARSTEVLVKLPTVEPLVLWDSLRSARDAGAAASDGAGASGSKVVVSSDLALVGKLSAGARANDGAGANGSEASSGLCRIRSDVAASVRSSSSLGSRGVFLSFRSFASSFVVISFASSGGGDFVASSMRAA
mmetsp:Transcript_41382/g.93298  ORF Transcript_41382/g.93298 Transcript_41382/m.93298 type:complete len:245 (-) Transcript_41382:555-1289(-)